MRPVLKSLDQHLYVLSTLALALMIQQVAAIKWGTEPQPFPRLIGWGSGVLDEKFWLPVVACIVTIVGLEYLYRRTLVGRAFLAIAEDNFAARALGLPERNLRIASYALAGVIGGIAGFSGGELLLAFFANGPLLNFYGFVPVALGGLGNNRGAIIGGLALGLFQQAANFLVGGIFSSVAVFTLFIIVLLAAPQGLFGLRPPHGGCDDRGHGATPKRSETRAFRCGAAAARARFSAILAAAMMLPFVSNDYWALIGTRAAIYWVLVVRPQSGRRLRGHLAIGYVALLTLGAYATSVLVAGNVLPPVPVFAALPIAGCVGAVFGVIVGLPALRLTHLLFRDVDARLRHHRHPNRAGLAERHRWWHRHIRSGIPSALQYRVGLLLSLHRICRSFSTWMSANVARQPVRPRLDRGARCRGRCRSHRHFQAAHADLRSFCSRARWPRSPADCSRACRPTSRRMPSPSTSRYLFFHRHPDRRTRLDPGPHARHHHPDHPA